MLTENFIVAVKMLDWTSFFRGIELEINRSIQVSPTYQVG